MKATDAGVMSFARIKKITPEEALDILTKKRTLTEEAVDFFQECDVVDKMPKNPHRERAMMALVEKADRLSLHPREYVKDATERAWHIMGCPGKAVR